VDRPCGSVVEHSLGKGEVARSIRAMGTSSDEGGADAAAGEVKTGHRRARP
jgi:hypothetical protein